MSKQFFRYNTMFIILDRSTSHYEDDAVSPPSSPIPGVKIFQGNVCPIFDKKVVFL